MLAHIPYGRLLHHKSFFYEITIKINESNYEFIVINNKTNYFFL